MVTNRNLASLGGLPARRPDQVPSQPPVAVAPGPSAGVIRATEVIIIGTGPAILVYSPTAGLGNLIGSWAGAAGSDQYGNSYPEGLSVDVGVLSGTTITGSTISGTSISGGTITGGTISGGSITGATIGTLSGGTVSGSTISGGTITGSTFDGTDFILNTAGLFFYSGTPGSGNLILSLARTSGTDGFGNSYFTGCVVYSGTLYCQVNSGRIDLFDTNSSSSQSILSFQTNSGLAKITSPIGASLDFQNFAEIEFDLINLGNVGSLAVGASGVTGAASDIEVQNAIGFHGRTQPSASSVGYLYMRSSDQSLCFKGTGGTNTVLAGP